MTSSDGPEKPSERDTISEFLESNEHLFVISGVFGALAVYISQMQSSITVSIPGLLNLGITSSLLLSILVSLLIFYQILVYYDIIPSIIVRDEILRYSRGLFFLGFMVSFYMLIATIGFALMSLTDAVMYLLSAIVIAVSSLVIIQIFHWISERYFEMGGVKWVMFTTAYSGSIFLISLFMAGFLSLYYDADATAILSLNSFDVLDKNLISIALLTAIFFVPVSGILGLLSASLLCSHMILSAASSLIAKTKTRFNH